MDELHHNLEVRPYNNTTVSNFWGALHNAWFSGIQENADL